MLQFTDCVIRALELATLATAGADPMGALRLVLMASKLRRRAHPVTKGTQH
jgi:hypothetical protein